MAKVLVLDDVLQICSEYLNNPESDPANAQTLVATCEALTSWDRRVSVDSRGAQVFTEFWAGIRDTYGSPFQSVVVSNEFWRIK